MTVCIKRRGMKICRTILLCSGYRNIMIKAPSRDQIYYTNTITYKLDSWNRVHFLPGIRMFFLSCVRLFIPIDSSTSDTSFQMDLIGCMNS